MWCCTDRGARRGVGIGGISEEGMKNVKDGIRDGAGEPGTAATGLIQVGWPGGMLTLRYTGIPDVTREARQEIQEVMQQFSADCQMMLVWFAGILGSQQAMQRHVQEVADRDEPLSINTYRPDGRVESVLARVPVEKIIDAFSAAGEFERLYAKAFVVFTYQIWEEVARPRIAAALKVEDPNHVGADLMGEWRHLRNWLVHRTENSEQQFFDKAKMLARLLSMQRNEPWLTADHVFALVQLLNQMQVQVNPSSLEFGLELVSLDARTIAAAARTLEAGGGMAIPVTAAMYPSAVLIVFSDGSTAVIHELDCSDKNRQFQNVDGGRWVRVVSREVAREVIEQLGKHEVRCERCGGNTARA